MLVLVELLVNFHPAKVKSRAAYALSAVVMTLIALCGSASACRCFGQPWPRALTWAVVVAGCVAAAYVLAYPFVRGRLTAR
ncbi:hypothetical protein AB0F42_17325 [Streptomyces buecherae]|uniref:hypothetical protein n=1 Tax=Streptomyces buecherae TaxID=2763006 RepID=UPI0033FDA4B9